MRLKDKVTIVTGAAGGIGLACAERFAAEGAKVVLADVNDDAGEAAAAAIREAGGEAVYQHCDVGEKSQVDALVATAVDSYGHLDCAICNAGIVKSADFLDVTEEDFDAVIRVNLKGVFLTAQAAAKQMVKQGTPGTIINMSSANAVMAIPNITPYVVSKGGLNQLTKVMAISLADRNIRVNAIGPGTIATELAKRAVLSDDAARRKVLSRTPLGRLGEPAEVASIAVFLATDDSSYVTGQTIYPDGGRLALNYTCPVPE